VPGAGTIVTGTLLDGWLSVDETVTIAPAGNNSRIRGIQSHEAAHGSVGPGRRVALNLGGIDHHDIGRGDMLGLPGQWVASDRFAVSLRLARFIGDIDRRGAFQLHIGSASRRVEISGLDGDVAVFQTRTGLPLTIGDRFILRDTGRQTVVAGGRVLDPAPGRTARALQSARSVDPAATPDEIADSVLSLRGADELSRIAAPSRGGRPTHAVIIGERAMTPARLDELTRRASSMVAAEHERHPLRPGMPMATLAERLSTGSAIVEWLVAESNDLERIGPDVAVAGRSHGLTDIQRTAWEAAQDRLATSLAVPGEAELGLDRDVVAHLLRTGELVRVSDDLVYLPSQIEEIKTRMAEMEKDFTVAEFRDRAGLSRKYAVPILEWRDKEGLTVRRGDLRHFR
jgi:selenocysteine-specific elongation factor